MSNSSILSDFSNAVLNPALSGFRQQEIAVERNGRQRIIEAPDNWTWVYTPKADDPKAVPEVYHRSPGMSVSGGYIPWQGGFEQEVEFVQGQRYLGRAAIIPNFRFNGGGNFQNDIQFQFVITDDSGQTYSSGWLSSDNPNWHGQQLEFLWVFEPRRSFMGKYRFECLTKWGNTNGDTMFSAIQMQRAPADYRDDVVQMIGDSSSTAPSAQSSTPATPQPSNQQESTMVFAIDMLDYIRGDGHIYDVEFKFPGHTWESGVERMQTQTDGRRFFHVKGGPGASEHNWEELWYDNQFIKRGTDISPSEAEYYSTEEDGQYGQKWIPRIVRVGDKHLAVPLVTFRHKSNGQNVSGKDPYYFGHWIELKQIHDSYTFESGIVLNDVIELWGYLDDGGKPGLNFERYFYAKGYGLVGWMDPTKNWRSYIKVKQVDGVNHLARKVVPTIHLPELPPLTGAEPKVGPPPVIPPANDSVWILQKVQPVYSFINLRALPTVNSDKAAKIEKAESLQYIAESSASEQPDGTWYPIMSQDRSSFMAWVRHDVIKFEPFAPATAQAVPAVADQSQPVPAQPAPTQPAQPTTSGTTQQKHIKVTLRLTPAQGVNIEELLKNIANISVDSIEIAED